MKQTNKQAESSLLSSQFWVRTAVEIHKITNLVQLSTLNFNNFVTVPNLSLYDMWHTVRWPTRYATTFCQVPQLVAWEGFDYSHYTVTQNTNARSSHILTASGGSSTFSATSVCSRGTELSKSLPCNCSHKHIQCDTLRQNGRSVNLALLIYWCVCRYFFWFRFPFVWVCYK